LTRATSGSIGSRPDRRSANASLPGASANRYSAPFGSPSFDRVVIEPTASPAERIWSHASTAASNIPSTSSANRNLLADDLDIGEAGRAVGPRQRRVDDESRLQRRHAVSHVSIVPLGGGVAGSNRSPASGAVGSIGASG